MIYEIKLMAFLAFVMLAGRSLLYLLMRDKPKMPLAEKAALSFGLGMGSLALGMFYLSFAGIELNLLNVSLLFTPLIALSVIIIRKDLKSISFSSMNMDISPKVGIILLIIIYVSMLVFVDATSQPLDQYDDRAIWGFKAKILYHDSTIYSADFFDPDRVHYHKQYPLLIPLAESMVYFFLGTVDDRLVKLIFPISFISLLAVFYYAQRRFFPTAHSLYFTALLATLPFILVTSLPLPDAGKGPSSGYADIPLAFFYFTASIYMYFWFFNTRERSYIAISAAFLSFAIFTKSEGLFLYLINLAAFFAYTALNYRRMAGRDAALSAIALLSPFIIMLPWFIYQANLPNDSDITFHIEALMGNLGRLPAILGYLSFNYLHPLHWNLVFPLLVLSALLTMRNVISDNRIYLYMLVILNVLSLIAMYSLSTIAPVELHLDTSFDRMTSHFIPIVVFLLSINLWYFGKNAMAFLKL